MDAEERETPLEDDGEGGGSTPRKRRLRRPRSIIELLLIAVVALGFSFLVRTYVLQSFYVPSGSMEPTLLIHDRFLVDKLAYDLHGVGRYDIIVFKRPPLDTEYDTSYLVKRVIGLPGDVISLQNGRVLIDGKPLKESFLPKGTITAPTGVAAFDLAKPFKVPANEYFMMGDNRGDSYDSRYWGPIPKSLIVGKVVFRFWPLNRIHLF